MPVLDAASVSAQRALLVTLGFLIMLVLTGAQSRAQGASGEAIGIFTAVQGQVTVAHLATAQTVPARLRDDILFRDIIQTQKESRTKALFHDDSLLTVGEDSRVEIIEHIYDPNQDRRHMVVTLSRGALRALVGKTFAGSGSKFEVHTPTAVAAARGTYFVVWIEGEITGVANIGSHGAVDFSAGGQTVRLDPSQFSFVTAGGVPMVPAMVEGNVPGFVRSAIAGTAVRDTPKPESPSGVVASTGGGVGRGGVAEAGTSPPGADGGVGPGGVAQFGTSPPGGGIGRDGDILTPPGVISGATGNPGVGKGAIPPGRSVGGSIGAGGVAGGGSSPPGGGVGAGGAGGPKGKP